MKTIKITSWIWALTLVVACGGSNPNRKLSSRVDQGHLASLEPSQRASEVEAYQDVFLAEWQIAFTEREVAQAETDTKVLENEIKSAKIALESAEIEMKAAAEGPDLNKQAEAEKTYNVATLELTMHKAKLAHAKEKAQYIKGRLDHEIKLHRRAEAKYELARAEILSAAGISPPNFNKGSYQSQFKERNALVEKSRASLAEKERKLQEAEKAFLTAQQAVTAAEGKPVAPIAAPKKVLQDDLPAAETAPTDTENSEPASDEDTPDDSNEGQEPATEEASEPADDDADEEPASATQDSASEDTDAPAPETTTDTDGESN